MKIKKQSDNDSLTLDIKASYADGNLSHDQYTDLIKDTSTTKDIIRFKYATAALMVAVLAALFAM